MTNFSVTIGYNSVITVNVKADGEEEARQKALSIFKKEKDKLFEKKLTLEDDTYSDAGILNLDKTWGML